MKTKAIKTKKTTREYGKILLRKDLQKTLLKENQVADSRKLTHWARG